MLTEWLPLLSLGFALGMLHALDADHVMAVSALANQKPSVSRTLGFSLYWALGHGGVLLACGVLLFALGMNIPEAYTQIAEIAVGGVLIVLGLVCLYQFRRENIQLVTHRHGDITHTHWKAKDHLHEGSRDNKGFQHQPVMVGMLHGLAGSAPALALVPVVTAGQVWLGMSYLLIFSLGVMLSMLTFGLGFSRLQAYLNQHYPRFYRGNRYMIAGLAIIAGGFWISHAI